MSPFRVFIASPVKGFKDYRREVVVSAREAEDGGGGMFEFCFFEREPISILPNTTPTESIFAHFGNEYDAFFLFFKDRVGPGTQAEFDHYLATLKVVNPNCQLWWRQIDCDTHDNSTDTLLRGLHGPGGCTDLHRLELGLVETPDRLANLFVSKLLNTSIKIQNGTLVPFADLKRIAFATPY